MRISKIGYGKTVTYSNYISERAYVEVDLDPEDDPQKVYIRAKEWVYKLLKVAPSK